MEAKREKPNMSRRTYLRALGQGAYNCVYEFNKIDEDNPSQNQHFAFRLSIFPVPSQEGINAAKQTLYELSIQQKASKSKSQFLRKKWEKEDEATGTPAKLLYKTRTEREKTASKWLDKSVRLSQEESAQRDVFFAERGVLKEWFHESDAPNPEAVVKLYRARYFLQWLQQYKSHFGPSVLETRSPHWKEYDRLTDVVADFDNMNIPICRNLETQRDFLEHEGIPFKWSVERMELLQPWAGRHPDDLKRDLFAMLWYFMTLGMTFGFRHHDLKPPNLMMRSYERPQHFRFTFDNGRKSWDFAATKIAVPIDFDFVTFNASTRMPQQRTELGTPNYMPPEAFVLELYNDARATQFEENSLLDEATLKRLLITLLEKRCYAWSSHNRRFEGPDGYDQWSIGIMTLQRLFRSYVPGVDLDNALLRWAQHSAEAQNFENAVINQARERRVKLLRWGRQDMAGQYLQYAFVSFMVTAIVQEQTYEEFEETLLSADYATSLVFGEQMMGIFKYAFTTRTFRDISNYLRERIPLEYRTLLKLLMDWNPRNRIGYEWLDLDLWEEFRASDLSLEHRPDATISWSHMMPFRLTGPDYEGLQSQISATAASCNACGRANPQKQCGNRQCGQGALYCNQACADADWARHNCLSAK